MLTKNEAYAVAEFIDMNIFTAIRNDLDWDSFQALRNLIHAYEKCCEMSGYVGMTDSEKGDKENEDRDELIDGAIDKLIQAGKVRRVDIGIYERVKEDE